ncbi:MAG TPA: antibiotic biosynthesis monooxygenase [Roseiarcus sp.]|nr:antibiotic biosynthesis monooxygenase [Roseiarcus sp.]
MIRVAAVITALPGRRAEVLALFRANMPNVHAEAGCIEYQPFVDAEGFGGFQAPIGGDAFVVLETWASAEALKAHAAAPHMAAYGKASKALIAERKIHIFAPA